MLKNSNRGKPSRPSPGRIAAAERGQRIISVASALFLKKGYADTSLNEVIRVAGGSKATIIEQFTNKAGLFAAVIEASAADLAEHLRPAAATAAIKPVLQQYGETILRFYLSPGALLAYRGIIAEGVKNPDIARMFYRRGHERIVAPIAQQLQLWHENGALLAANFPVEADRFTHMLRNGIYEQHLLGFRRRVTAGEIRRQVAGSVRVFIDGLGKS